MIVAERKPIEEIKGFLAGHKRILVLGCGTCVTVCLAGGEREVTTLASVLRLSDSFEVEENTIERQCDAEFFAHIKGPFEIGFDWVCFFGPEGGFIFIILCGKEGCIRFCP